MKYLSNSMGSNTGAPQGCVLSPLLFALYTSDLKCSYYISNSCSIVKYADDTSVTGFVSNDDETAYRDEVTRFVNWCDENLLVINVREN